MALAMRDEYEMSVEKQQLEVRKMVLEGLEQVQMGKTKDFNKVCDRLENKYRNAALRN
ncbi:MAG: hypothetical protein LUF35_03875 [Lachnospiraceae bacterium]|nr:hypothetical protein [Lachnospiraceae bacterium]